LQAERAFKHVDTAQAPNRTEAAHAIAGEADAFGLSVGEPALHPQGRARVDGGRSADVTQGRIRFDQQGAGLQLDVALEVIAGPQHDGVGGLPADGPEGAGAADAPVQCQRSAQRADVQVMP